MNVMDENKRMKRNTENRRKKTQGSPEIDKRIIQANKEVQGKKYRVKMIKKDGENTNDQGKMKRKEDLKNISSK